MEESNRSKTYKGISIQTVITITLGILGILYFSIMSRLLSQEDFGCFAIITAITAILTSLSEAGLGAAVIQSKENSKAFIKTAVTLSFIIGSFFTLFLFCTSSVFSELMVKSDKLTLGFRIMSFSFILYAVNSVGRAVIIKQLKFLQYGIYDIVAYAFSSVVGILLAYYNYGFYAAVIAMFLHQFFLFITIVLSHRDLAGFILVKSYARQIIYYGGWLTGSVIVRNITQQIDKLITTNWIPVAVLGAYNRPAGFISQITGHLNSIFDTILFPVLSGINDDKSKINSSYEKAVVLIILYSIVLTSIFILGAEGIISIFLGEKWLYLTGIFQIASLSIIFLCYGRLADCFFRSLGVVESYFYTRCCVLLCTCICVYLGCQYGIVGLAIGVTTSRAADSITKIMFLSPYLTINRRVLYYKLIKSIIVPIAVFIGCFFLMNHLPYGSFISLAIFLVILIIIGAFYPKLFGETYYSNIYLVIKNIIYKKINRI